eukprot:TRINITY_DN15164_c0_g1_i1.p1 TRINITY_DN15164_c0_g1~~TRINITY_DN15164_c0_g1_i1.p1  ORF type:complete len:370 (+),score=22.17 TRINITY_DN15164_c0_g1_i1:345-1454(+)
MANSSGQRARFKLLRLAWLLIMGLCVCPMLEPVDGARALLGTKHTLFVFGDSYVDNGNLDPSLGIRSFRYPYGYSRKRPTGRFSDGRVLSDFIAKGLHMAPPAAFYPLPQPLAASSIANGLNFAKGGSGVFESTTDAYGVDNATLQIQRFSQVVASGAYSLDKIGSAFTLLSISGNDYATFVAGHGLGNVSIYPPFIASLVSQMAVDITKLYALGLRKFIVLGLQPLGCLPRNTQANNFTKCDDTINALSGLHNQYLTAAVAKLRVSLPGSSFVILDEFKSFSTILANLPGFGLDNSLVPCCAPIGTASCGDHDSAGNALFTVCKKPKKRLFWDSIHPTDAGWDKISALYFKSQNFTSPGPNLSAFIAA